MIMDGISIPSRSSVRRTFVEIGNICFGYPWELILLTSLAAIGILSSDNFWQSDAIVQVNTEVPSKLNELDTVVLIATKCLIIAYCYLQLRRCALLGSRYEFGLAALLTVAHAYVFTSAVLSRIYERQFLLNDVLPVFLLLTDFTRVYSLARCVMVSLSVSNSPKHAIQSGLVACGPSSCVDSALQVLVIGLGIFTSNESLERVCAFGCVAIALNLLMFICYYPALLTLVFQLSSPLERERVLREIRTLIVAERAGSDYSFEKRTNPVLQRIKVIMSAGLIIVHAQLRVLINGNAIIERSLADSVAHEASSSVDQTEPPIVKSTFVSGDPNISVVDVPFYGAMTYRIDSLFTFFLAFLLILKYTFLDNVLDDLAFLSVRSGTRQRLSSTAEQRVSPSAATISKDSTQNGTSAEVSVDKRTQPNAISRNRAQTRNESASVVNEPETQTQDSSRSRLSSGSEFDSQTDEAILEQLRSRRVAPYTLEALLKPNFRRAVDLRRKFMIESSFDKQRVGEALERLPFSAFDDYQIVHGVCCENVVGYVPLPVGIAGPLLVNGRSVHIPLATSEGGLIASTNRGCRAILDSCAVRPARVANESQSTSVGSDEYAGIGVRAFLTDDGMSRGPVLRFSSGRRAAAVREWLRTERNFELMKVEFDSTSRFASLKRIEVRQIGRLLYLRFVAMTGDAMGMNMVSRATERVLTVLRRDHFTDMVVVALSGNVCVDKKASAMNWIEGRGKSITCETIIRADVVRRVLKTSVDRMIETHTAKNLIGSAVAGAAFGGQNAHAANLVAAMYIACGQDAGQIVTSSSCLMTLEREPRNIGRRTRHSTEAEGGRSRNNSTNSPPRSPSSHDSSAAKSNNEVDAEDVEDDLYVSCTMPCLEVGVVGGGTILSAQRACLALMGVQADDRDASVSSAAVSTDTNSRTADSVANAGVNDANAAGTTRRLPGERASEFAMAVCSAVLAGELSLLAALSVGHLTEAHERLNRRKRT